MKKDSTKWTHQQTGKRFEKDNTALLLYRAVAVYGNPQYAKYAPADRLNFRNKLIWPSVETR